MRWQTEMKQRSLDERFGFLLFPKTINGETRWLEFARWEIDVRVTGTGRPYSVAVRWLS